MAPMIAASEDLREATDALDSLVDLRSRQELAALLAGTEAGLALFDEELTLIACNTRYRRLFGFAAHECETGTPFATLLRHASERGGAIADAKIIDTTLDRLRRGDHWSTRMQAGNDTVIEVTRRVTANGMVVETVHEIGPAREIAAVARSLMVQALDVMADGFALYDSLGRLVVYNRRFVEYKPSVADLIMPGVSFEHLVREEAFRGGVNLQGRSLDDYAAERLWQHKHATAPSELLLADGRWLQIREQLTGDGCIVSLISDITAMKERELDLLRVSDALQARNTQFDAALNNMAQGICLFDANHRLLVTNRRYLEMYGFSADVIKPGVQIEDIVRYGAKLGIVAEEEVDRFLSERLALARRKYRVTAKQRLLDGRIIAVTSAAMPDGGSIATYADISERERNAERLRDHALRLERSNRDLEEFAYVASHDLQEPLRKIEAFGARLATRYGADLPEDGQFFIERMQDAATRMRRLIADLLGYARLTTKPQTLQPVDLSSVMAEVVGDQQIRIDEAGADVRVDRLPIVPGDHIQMSQLLQNLLSNALKFVRPGVRPVVDIAAAIESVPQPSGTARLMHVIRFRDNGIGFENASRDQIFKIFHRLHSRAEYEGTGVGLATCRKIVERHGGSMDCEGRPGDGATFSIYLPLTDAHASL